VVRLLCGVGAGFGLCAGPIFLSEMAPIAIKGRVGVSLNPNNPQRTLIIFLVGVLTQLSIVFGLFSTQAMGLRLATPTEWRLVLFISSFIAVAQLLLSPFMVESPTWLNRRNLHQEQKSSAARLWGNNTIVRPDCKIFFRRVAQSLEDCLQHRPLI
jgi:MFS transporter, SP family, solute carrier family 2 (facilitated glucose transporter), member 3